MCTHVVCAARVLQLSVDRTDRLTDENMLVLRVKHSECFAKLCAWSKFFHSLYPSLFYCFCCSVFFLSNLFGKRGFLARRSTARRRHRYWTRERALRLTFLRALQVTNAATYQVRPRQQLNPKCEYRPPKLVDRSNRILVALICTLNRKKTPPTHWKKELYSNPSALPLVLRPSSGHGGCSKESEYP